MRRGDVMIAQRSTAIVPSEGTHITLRNTAGDDTQALLTKLQLRLLVVRHQMSDLAQWQRAQADGQSLPTELIDAVQDAMDKLSDEARQLCESISAAPADSLTDLKHKALALEFLLPEDADAHTMLCRSLCSDIGRM